MFYSEAALLVLFKYLLNLYRMFYGEAASAGKFQLSWKFRQLYCRLCERKIEDLNPNYLLWKHWFKLILIIK